ncbi:LysM peptidoglycan-binding domain-containing protein [Halochromatium glycolicum]|uniref:Peptidoglycan-binding protein n=1 Tax=Halochromatium glycolicum TaxID=85075 RepID=A0AAJ0U1H2_9GAMM|nr:LysM domain-containing protein [Halochromatium glycolicum]MBK1703122.1 peptidoglycan-binding protein [Halochromatium glycolicum]
MLAVLGLCAGSSVCPVQAQVQLQPDAPEAYVVRPGDTLWEIAGRFLRAPWRWPEVWRGNPEISDPNRIYPGDRLVLDLSDAGAPRVRYATDGMRVVKLSPRVRVTELDAAIPTVPIGTVAPFLSRPWVADSRELDDAPYVVGFPRERLLAGSGDRIFVRQITEPVGRRYEVLRPGEALRDPDTDELLGYEASFVAEARLERPGDPAILLVTNTAMQVEVGDRLHPARDENPIRSFAPKPAPPALEGHIISVLDGVSQIGQYDVVVLDRGRRDGVEVGHVFGVFRGGQEAEDPVARNRDDWNWRNETPLDSAFWLGDWQITGWNRDRPDPNTPLPLHRRAERPSETYIVPSSRAGLVMVFRVFPRVSFALVMRANQAMHVGETVARPGEG